MAWPVSPLGELDVLALPHRRVDKLISSARACEARAAAAATQTRDFYFPRRG